VNAPTLRPPPPSLLAGGVPTAFGMFNAPLPDVDLVDAALPGRPGVLKRLRLKRWQHVLVVHPNAALMFAAVDAGYLKLGWARFVERATGDSVEVARKSPVLDVGIARSLWNDRSWLRSRGLSIELHNHLDASQHRAQVESDDITAELTIHHDATPLVVHLPLPRGRSMYSHKVVLPVSGSFVARGQTYTCDAAHSFAVLDIHQAHYPRHTFWKWATLAVRTDAGVVGLNLTENPVTDAACHENAVWRDGELSLVEAPTFDFSDEDAWSVRTQDGRVDLTFDALGERREDIRAGVIESVFRQRYGHFTGTVDGVEVSRAFGLMEDHKSVW